MFNCKLSPKIVLSYKLFKHVNSMPQKAHGFNKHKIDYANVKNRSCILLKKIIYVRAHLQKYH